MNNSIKQVVEYLAENPLRTETQINEAVWSYNRSLSWYSNKKYATMIRRGLLSGKIARVKFKKTSLVPADVARSQYLYYVPGPTALFSVRFPDVKVNVATPKFLENV